MVYDPFSGPRKFRTWSKEGPLWWYLYRTVWAGDFREEDRKEWLTCKGRYIIMLDHTDDSAETPRAKEFSIHLLDRLGHFMAAKVSKFSRDGEKTLVLLAKDNSMYKALKEFAQQWNFQLVGFKINGEYTDHEKKAHRDWGTYLTRLARAHYPMK